MADPVEEMIAAARRETNRESPLWALGAQLASSGNPDFWKLWYKQNDPKSTAAMLNFGHLDYDPESKLYYNINPASPYDFNTWDFYDAGFNRVNRPGGVDERLTKDFYMKKFKPVEDPALERKGPQPRATSFSNMGAGPQVPPSAVTGLTSQQAWGVPAPNAVGQPSAPQPRPAPAPVSSASSFNQQNNKPKPLDEEEEDQWKY